jgi:hypothetical protein
MSNDRPHAKVALKLLLWYLLASLLATALSLGLQPSHAHIPPLVLLAFFPAHPLIWARDAIHGNVSPSNALCLFQVAAAVGVAAWRYRRRKAEVAN